MRLFSIKKITVIFFILLSLLISGCSSLMQNMPAPPSALVKIQLQGPYDSDIPEKYIKQLKGAT